MSAMEEGSETWSDEIRAIVIAKPCVVRPERDELIVEEVENIAKYSTLVGKPVLLEHQDDLVIGKVTRVFMHPQTRALIGVFRLNLGNDVGRWTYDQVKKGTLGEVSLAHDIRTKQPHELSICMEGRRKGSFIARFSASEITFDAEPVKFDKTGSQQNDVKLSEEDLKFTHSNESKSFAYISSKIARFSMAQPMTDSAAGSTAAAATAAASTPSSTPAASAAAPVVPKAVNLPMDTGAATSSAPAATPAELAAREAAKLTRPVVPVVPAEDVDMQHSGDKRKRAADPIPEPVIRSAEEERARRHALQFEIDSRDKVIETEREKSKRMKLDFDSMKSKVDAMSKKFAEQEKRERQDKAFENLAKLMEQHQRVRPTMDGPRKTYEDMRRLNFSGEDPEKMIAHFSSLFQYQIDMVSNKGANPDTEASADDFKAASKSLKFDRDSDDKKMFTPPKEQPASASGSADGKTDYIARYSTLTKAVENKTHKIDTRNEDECSFAIAQLIKIARPHLEQKVRIRDDSRGAWSHADSGSTFLRFV